MEEYLKKYFWKGGKRFEADLRNRESGKVFHDEGSFEGIGCGTAQSQGSAGCTGGAGGNGRTPLENARQKAEFYYSIFKMPVFSCDSGMYIEGLPEEEARGSCA